MSLIFIECLFLSACLIFLMGINPVTILFSALTRIATQHIFAA